MITQYNPLLPNLKFIFRNHLSILYSNQPMLVLFHKILYASHTKDKNLQEILSPYLFDRDLPSKTDIWKNFLVVSRDLTCFATKQKYEIKGIFECDNRNVIYLTSCKCCGKQYVGSATGFKEQFRIHKSDIKTNKVRRGVANHLLDAWRSTASKFEYLQVQLTKLFSVQMNDDIDKVLWEREIILGSTIITD